MFTSFSLKTFFSSCILTVKLLYKMSLILLPLELSCFSPHVSCHTILYLCFFRLKQIGLLYLLTMILTNSLFFYFFMFLLIIVALKCLLDKKYKNNLTCRLRSMKLLFKNYSSNFGTMMESFDKSFGYYFVRFENKTLKVKQYV
jgi:hypothetical protein